MSFGILILCHSVLLTLNKYPTDICHRKHSARRKYIKWLVHNIEVRTTNFRQPLQIPELFFQQCSFAKCFSNKTFHTYHSIFLRQKSSQSLISCKQGHNVELPHYCFKKVMKILYSTAINTHRCRKGITHWQSNSMSRLHETLPSPSSLSIPSITGFQSH